MQENDTHQTNIHHKNSLGIPIAIIVAAALIVGAIFLNGNNNTVVPKGATTNPNQIEQVTPETEVLPVTENDHIRGNPNAPIMLVEYSDYDCPFCKNFHETLTRIMDDYGADGKVAWVYRHFPLQQLHPNAPALAVAAECVAEQGGNDAFWTFSNLIFSEREADEQTDPAKLSGFAETAGVDKGQFELCLNSGKYDAAITEDINQAIAAGGKGTPYTIVLVGNQQGIINGAQPYEAVKKIIDGLISQIEGGTG